MGGEAFVASPQCGRKNLTYNDKTKKKYEETEDDPNDEVTEKSEQKVQMRVPIMCPTKK